MKLDLDCIRDILMDIEEIVGINTLVYISEDNYTGLSRCSKYDYNTLAYHLRQCNLSGYFLNCTQDLANGFTIVDLSPKAHELLANIRDNNVWKKVLEIAKGVASFSLSLLSPVAESVIKQKLGLQ